MVTVPNVVETGLRDTPSSSLITIEKEIERGNLLKAEKVVHAHIFLRPSVPNCVLALA